MEDFSISKKTERRVKRAELLFRHFIAHYNLSDKFELRNSADEGPTMDSRGQHYSESGRRIWGKLGLGSGCANEQKVLKERGKGGRVI